MKEVLPTPGAVLDFWIGPASEDSLAAASRNPLWFRKSFQTDQTIADLFLPLMAALADGLAYDWAGQGARARLAAIIALDQFSRNVFRDHASAFRHDSIALGLAKEGLLLGEDLALTEIERAFLYLPLEHSERLHDQDMAVSLFEKLARTARPSFQPLCDSLLDFARRHRAVIAEFGRFPHRNKALKRQSTPAETAYLAQPGAGF